MGFKLALIQMKVEGGQKERNLACAVSKIKEAAADGAHVALLPEALDLGWTHPSARDLAEPVPEGIPCRILSEAAEKHRIYVCAGLTERDGERVYNSAVLLGPDGTLLGKHRKLNELGIGHASYDQGDRLNVIHTELGTIGLMICADGFAVGHVLSRALGYMGADIILSPSAWAVPANHDHRETPYGETWRNCYKPVAKDFAMWIAGASNVGIINGGEWSGRKCIGCSMVVGPDGEEVLQGPYGEDAQDILYVDIELKERPARGCGWAEHWNKQETHPPSVFSS